MHQETKFEDTCATDGWYMESMSKAFVYIAGMLDSVSRAGKALSGWERTNRKIFQPSCTFMTQENSTKIENLIIKLFQCSVPQMNRAGKLWPLAKCLLATTLMYLSEMIREYPKHKILVVIRGMADDCGISMKELLQWGTEVKDKFVTDHAVATNHGSELLAVMFEKMVVMERMEKQNMEVGNIDIRFTMYIIDALTTINTIQINI